jgi:hypothetical protein
MPGALRRASALRSDVERGALLKKNFEFAAGDDRHARRRR